MKSSIVALFRTLVSTVSISRQAYRRNDAIETLGTHLIAEVEFAPLFLVETFGKPANGDGEETTGEYTFVGAKPEPPFTVYDWKSTSRCEYGEDLPSPEEFWAGDESVLFSIGGRDQDASAFKAWLLAKYQDWEKARAKAARK